MSFKKWLVHLKERGRDNIHQIVAVNIMFCYFDFLVCTFKYMCNGPGLSGLSGYFPCFWPLFPLLFLSFLVCIYLVLLVVCGCSFRYFPWDTGDPDVPAHSSLKNTLGSEGWMAKEGPMNCGWWCAGKRSTASSEGQTTCFRQHWQLSTPKSLCKVHCD